MLVPELQETLETLRHKMSEDLLPDDAKYFRAVAGDEGVSVSPGVRSPTNRGPHAGIPRGVVDREGIRLLQKSSFDLWPYRIRRRNQRQMLRQLRAEFDFFERQSTTSASDQMLGSPPCVFGWEFPIPVSRELF